MKRLCEIQAPVARPERILQFGEGNFLRAFVDWMVQKINDRGLWNGSVVLVQPIAQGLAPLINQNKGMYTVLLRGIEKGEVVEEVTRIDSVSRCINPYSEYDAYLACAENPDLRFIISNTTEAGIAYQGGCTKDDRPPASFPAKVAQFLYHRWRFFKGDPNKGIVLIPCELIDRNGDTLKRVVLQYAAEWGYEKAFTDWLEKSCAFLNSLVDRIVTGYPKEEAPLLWEKLGYQDELLDTAEPFNLWVIEGDSRYGEELPFHKAGCNVLWVPDMTPYRTRKVRILNGAHTASVLIAYLAGFNTVKEMVDSPVGKAYLERLLYQEVMPLLPLPKEEVEAFAASTLERFANPYIKHRLLDISLNSVSKYKARVLPSLLEAVQTGYRRGSAPAQTAPVLVFSLAALIAFYRGSAMENNALVGKRQGESYPIRDDLPVLEALMSLWQQFEKALAAGAPPNKAAEELVQAVLARTDWWGEDLRSYGGLSDAVTAALILILEKGPQAAMEQVAFQGRIG
ncbi:MAG: tagaturonate reductase [Breznakiellaceae bacterium]